MAEQVQPTSPNVLQEIQQQFLHLQLQVLRTRQAVSALQAKASLKEHGRMPKFDVEFTAQFGEDFFAWHLLDGQLDGFFIEAGAFDGYRHSATYAFEAIGWRGLLVEPIPSAAEQCRQRRPSSRVVPAALSRRGAAASAPFHLLKDPYGGMLSYLNPTPRHAEATGWASKSVISVPVVTLDSLLADHTGPIDLAVIDVEGNELDVLDGFDLNRFRPRLMFVEENSQGQDPAIQNYMSRFGYSLALRVMVNDVYVRKDELAILERANWLSMV